MRILDEIVDLTVRCCDPQEILLFGSYAKGNADRHSDIDLLVVGDFRSSPYLRHRELSELLGRFAIRVDVHLVTPGELELHGERAGGFLYTIARASVSLYRRGDCLTGVYLARYDGITGGT